MGRKRINPLGYSEITKQAEKTINMLMRPARIVTNSELTKEQAVSRAFGAFVLWQDLTASYASSKDDSKRMFDLLIVNESEESD